MKPKLFFITGVSGSGKTTLIPYLKEMLPQDQYEIHDFDERGVPEGVDEKWRQLESKMWLDLGMVNISRNISTIICGLSQPDEVYNIAHESIDLPIEFILLDLSSERIQERLGVRYSSPQLVEDLIRVTGQSLEESIEDNIQYAGLLRKLCADFNATIVDTSNLEPKEVAHTMVSLIEV